jgi:hypothetical protein
MTVGLQQIRLIFERLSAKAYIEIVDDILQYSLRLLKSKH